MTCSENEGISLAGASQTRMSGPDLAGEVHECTSCGGGLFRLNCVQESWRTC